MSSSSLQSLLLPLRDLMTATAGEMQISTIFSCIFFGTNFLLCLLFQVVRRSSKKSAEPDNGKKKLSKPFEGTLECYTNLTWDLFLVGGIVFLTYVCENHWFYPHSSKEYSRDLFMFVCLVFFLVAAYTIAPVKDLTLLSRDQTEEWKGWMQFIFLLYHYFHAEEVYNSVRVMITCYVWMTGFGNFSFFYIKQDFGWLRYVQMLWRLNFSVILLMFAHNNTYILYYICPLHTFYFTLVYCTMFVMSSVNHSKWSIRFKLMALGCLIYAIWDLNGRVFNLFWGWLGTDPIIGAKLGTLWEWYFRSSLDHYSTYFGMIFALNFPLAEQYFNSARGYPLYLAAVVMGGVTIWWFQSIYSLEKLEYNLVHNYFAFIPLTAYIFFRNITPGIRSKVSMSLHALGKTTLETYLLQHHVWLTSNAKTLLTIVPDMPWVNFFLASGLFYFLSKELYRLTMTLRGMVLPDNGTIAARNMIGGLILTAVAYVLAMGVFYVKPTFFVIFLVCIFCFLMVALVIRKRCTDYKVNKNFEHTWRHMFFIGCIILAIGMMSASLFNDPPEKSQVQIRKASTPNLTKRCRNMATSGHWIDSSVCDPSLLKTAAMCKSTSWEWLMDSSCPFHSIGPSEGVQLFKNKKVMFLGDSQSRNLFHSFNRLVSKDYVENKVVRHADLSNHDEKLDIAVDFKWTPFMQNVTSTLKQNCITSDRADFYVVGATLWDALHLRNVDAFQIQLKEFVNEIEICSAARTNQAKGKVIWVAPPFIVDSALTSPEKAQYMSESQVARFRQAVDGTSLRDVAVALINPTNVTHGKESTASDGVHYGADVYNVLAEVVANVFSADNGLVASRNKPVKKNLYPNGKPTGSMSDPKLGFCILLLSAVMIFGWDSWLGIGMVSLWLFGIKPDWERAYRPLLDKIKPEKHVHEDEKDSLIEMESK